MDSQAEFINHFLIPQKAAEKVAVLVTVEDDEDNERQKRDAPFERKKKRGTSCQKQKAKVASHLRKILFKLASE